METKICSKCNECKPLHSYYKVRRSGKAKYEAQCIQCTTKQRRLDYHSKDNPIAAVVEQRPVSTYVHYLVTVVDENFEEFTGTISARLPFRLTAENFALGSFTMDGKRLFYEAKVDKMSADEYYSIHNRDKDQKGLGCPNLTISKTMAKKDVKVALHEFLTALYFFHNRC